MPLFTFGRAACAAAVGGVLAFAPAAAQGRRQGSSPDRGFELGVDAELAYTSTHVDGAGGQPPGATSLSVPVGNVRVAFPTSSPVAFEVAGNLTHFSSDGDSFTSSLVELGLPISLTDRRNALDWFVRPAIGWQHTTQSRSPDFNRATLAGGVGLRAPVSSYISLRYELRDTYFVKSRGTSANVIGLLAGVSVFTR